MKSFSIKKQNIILRYLSRKYFTLTRLNVYIVIILRFLENRLYLQNRTFSKNKNMNISGNPSIRIMTYLFSMYQNKSWDVYDLVFISVDCNNILSAPEPINFVLRIKMFFYIWNNSNHLYELLAMISSNFVGGIFSCSTSNDRYLYSTYEQTYITIWCNLKPKHNR